MERKESSSSSSSLDPKRKAENEESNDSASVFKKARYEWQIKRVSNKGDGLHHCQTDEVSDRQPKKRCSKLPAQNLDLHVDCPENDLHTSKHSSDQDSVLHVSPDSIRHENADSTHACSLNRHQENLTSLKNLEYETDRNKIEPQFLTGTVNFDKDTECDSEQTLSVLNRNNSNNVHTDQEFHVGVERPQGDSDFDTGILTAPHSQEQSVPIQNVSFFNDTNASSVASRWRNSFDSYLTKRQNNHIAKAVVDNAINKTLEDMGVSPEPNDEFTIGKSHVENAGISQAIQSQGLIPQHQAACSARLAPILSHVTQLSEIVFTQANIQGHCLTDSHSAFGGDQSSNFDNGMSDISQSQSVSNSDLLDQAVSMAISSNGLVFQRNAL